MAKTKTGTDTSTMTSTVAAVAATGLIVAAAAFGVAAIKSGLLGGTSVSGEYVTLGYMPGYAPRMPGYIPAGYKTHPVVTPFVTLKSCSELRVLIARRLDGVIVETVRRPPLAAAQNGLWLI